MEVRSWKRREVRTYLLRLIVELVIVQLEAISEIVGVQIVVQEALEERAVVDYTLYCVKVSEGL